MRTISLYFVTYTTEFHFRRHNSFFQTNLPNCIRLYVQPIIETMSGLGVMVGPTIGGILHEVSDLYKQLVLGINMQRKRKSRITFRIK